VSGAQRQLTAGLFALCLAAMASAQAGPPEPPAGEALVRVQLVHESGPAAVAGVEVILYSLSAAGDPGLRRGQADAQGRIVFEGLSNAPDVVYLVGTRLGGVPFGSRFEFAADEQEHALEIAVTEPSPDASALESGEVTLRLEAGCSDLRVHHTHELYNRSQRVVYVPAELRDQAAPLLELDLPHGASEIETPLGGGGDSFERSGRSLRFWGPVYPGTQQIEFGYGLSFEQAEELTLGFPQGAERVSLLTPLEGIAATSEALSADGERPMPAGIHAVQRSAALSSDATLRLAIRRAPTGVQPDSGSQDPKLRLAESRLWLELDDAVLDVSEQHELRVEGSEPLHSRNGAPLFCLPLPASAQDVRFGTASFDLDLSRDPSGSLAVGGPLPPGESSLSLRYRLPTSSEPFEFERSLETEVELLSVLVADTGILPHSTRLHQRRAVRTEDRAYLHLEAFAIAADETIELSLERLSRGGGSSALASTGFVFALALASLFFLAAPLGESASSAKPAIRETSAAIERRAVYEAIEVLDEDHELDKVSDSDHQRMRDELRARAVALLQVERSAQTSAPPAVSDAPPRCPGCAAESRPGDRFCAQCGASLPAVAHDA
jgi:hypothetical protein